MAVQPRVLKLKVKTMKIDVNWEDETNDRLVKFEAVFSIADSQLSIHTLTPKNVSFVCPESNVVLRTIGVHTETGRAKLRNYFIECDQLDVLIEEIADRHDLSIAF